MKCDISYMCKFHALWTMIPDAWKNWRNTNPKGHCLLGLVVVYQDQMNSCDLALNQENLVVEADCVVPDQQLLHYFEPDFAHHFVTNSVEDETRGNATEALVDSVDVVGLVVASVLCEQPERI